MTVNTVSCFDCVSVLPYVNKSYRHLHAHPHHVTLPLLFIFMTNFQFRACSFSQLYRCLTSHRMFYFLCLKPPFIFLHSQTYRHFIWQWLGLGPNLSPFSTNPFHDPYGVTFIPSNLYRCNMFISGIPIFHTFSEIPILACLIPWSILSFIGNWDCFSATNIFFHKATHKEV